VIQHIPTPKDFFAHGTNLLNVSWDNAIRLLTDADDALTWDRDMSDDFEEYQRSAKPSLISSISIALQGIEICLKGKISEVSPFLLVYGNPRDWPKAEENVELHFADFRTIDAQDLIKVHNLFANEPIHPEFSKMFNSLRKKRNSVVHTVDKRIDVNVVEIIRYILDAFHYLFPEKSWIKTRRQFIENSPSNVIYPDSEEYAVVWEFSLLTELLKPSEMKKYFSFNKKQRRYICPECQYIVREGEMLPRTASLSPNTPRSTNLYCFVCDTNITVEREKCEHDDCSGNVISKDSGNCATCGY